MKIYYKCACCGEIQNKVIILMKKGGKSEMFKCLDAGLKKFQEDLNYKNRENEKKKSKERVEMALDTFEGENKKVPGIIQEAYVPEDKREKPKGGDEPVGGEDEGTTYTPADAGKDGGRIDKYFKAKKDENEVHAKARVLDGLTRGIKYSECKEWIDVGFKGEDYDFVRGLKETKSLTPESCLNHVSYEDLKADYEEETKPDKDTE